MKELYLGIDLGTTNSVVGYGNMTKHGWLKCNVIDLDRKTENGGRSRDKLLPSAVYYQKDKITKEMLVEVGDYAKGRYGIRLGYVAKSIKSLMGMSDSAHLAEEIPDKTPAQVSAQILRFMLNGAKRRLMEEEINDAIITVPASFDAEQCQATLEAARLAGFDVENSHDVLLYEPKAVIYDFVNMMESGEIDDTLLNLETPKNVLVFDLGGGTLDVTIHQVGYAKDDMITIRDLAISRYTKLGGDDFDELIAEAMLPRFEEQCYIKVPDIRKEEVMCILRKKAEQLKREVSSDMEYAISSGKTLGPSYMREVFEMVLFDSYSYMDEFTLEEIEAAISPLMGEHLTKNDVKRIDQLKEKDMNNIIYPILDVLAKAGSNCNIDAVILNGGMTKFYPIKRRIDAFFGLQSLVTNDPDLAVARGAVYYHYCLHKYGVKKTTLPLPNAQELQAEELMEEIEELAAATKESIFNVGTILNDSLNIGLGADYVSALVKAGTELPYISPEICGKYIMSSESDTISLQIFLGRGKTKNLPNRRIADRLIKFQKRYPAGTSISLQITIDNLRFMRVQAWVTGDKEQKAIVAIDTNGKGVEKVKSNAAKILSNETFALNAKSEINNLKILAAQNHKKPMKNIKMRTNEIFSRIERASNKEEFYAPMVELLDTLTQRDRLRGYLYTIGVSLAEGWNDIQRRSMLRYCKSHFSTAYYGMVQDNFVVMSALNYIAKWDERGIGFLRELMQSGQYSKYAHNIVEAIVRYMDLTNLEVAHMLESFPADLYTKNTIHMIYNKMQEQNITLDLYDILIGMAQNAREEEDLLTYTSALSIFQKTIELETLDFSRLSQLRQKLRQWKKREHNEERYYFTDAIEEWVSSKSLTQEQQQRIEAYL